MVFETIWSRWYDWSADLLADQWIIEPVLASNPVSKASIFSVSCHVTTHVRVTRFVELRSIERK